MMSSFYCSLRFLSNEGCKSYRPLHPQSLTPLPLFPPSHLKVNEACWGSCHSQHNVSTYPRFHPRVFPRNHDVYSVLSEYTRRIPTLPPQCIPDRRIPMYTHPQIFPITPNPSLRHSYNCQFRPLAHSELVIKSDNI